MILVFLRCSDRAGVGVFDWVEFLRLEDGLLDIKIPSLSSKVTLPGA